MDVNGDDCVANANTAKVEELKAEVERAHTKVRSLEKQIKELVWARDTHATYHCCRGLGIEERIACDTRRTQMVLGRYETRCEGNAQMYGRCSSRFEACGNREAALEAMEALRKAKLPIPSWLCTAGELTDDCLSM